jgi:predicted alpha/beta superfamily hydrolase
LSPAVSKRAARDAMKRRNVTLDAMTPRNVTLGAMTRRRAALGALALAAPALAQPRPSTAGPTVQVLTERLTLPGLQRERTLRLYLPPSYASAPTRRYPVLYLHDGQNLFDDATSFVGEWGVDEALDALARTSGFEAIAVGIDHGGDKRFNEMSLWPHERFGAGEGEAYVDFVVRIVKPLIDARYRTRTDAASTLIGGASMGGLISHKAILRHPEVFGRALIFSPAYWTAPERMAEHVQAHRLPRGARLYFHAGGREGSRSMVPLTERMLELTRAQGDAATMLNIAPEAEHNERAWRAEFERALRWLFELP